MSEYEEYLYMKSGEDNWITHNIGKLTYVIVF